MKEVVVYTLKNEIPDIDQNILSENIFEECDTRQQYSIGFSNDEVKELDPFTSVISITTQEKKPNKAEINRRVDERITDFVTKLGEQPTKEDITNFKEAVFLDLLASTFPDKAKNYQVVFNKDFLYVFGANHKKAEDILYFLRTKIGSVPVSLLETSQHIETTITNYVEKEVSEKITLGNKAVLVTESDRTVQVSKGSLYDSEAVELIKEGAVVTAVNIEYDAALNVVITNDFHFKSMKVSGEKYSESFNYLINLYYLVKELTEELIKDCGGLVDKTKKVKTEDDEDVQF